MCMSAFTSRRAGEAASFGDETVDGGEGGGDGEAGLNGARAAADQAAQGQAGQQEADREPARDDRVGRPPASFHDVTERVELALDHAAGHRDVSLDLSWATSHRQVSCMDARVCWGHAMCVRRQALQASAASASSATVPPAITRCSHGVSNSGASAPATMTMNNASSANSAGTTTPTAMATQTTSLRLAAHPSPSYKTPTQ